MLSDFNPAQRAAVEYCDGPSLVIAGAGSGKTRVLTYKIAYLMEKGLEPWSILALTFTNKAASEMKQRIARIVGDEKARYLWMGTFHSVFLRILRAEHACLGFTSNFTIYDSADSKSLVKAIIKEMGLDDKVYKPSAVLSRISNAKNQLVTAEEYAANTNNRQIDFKQHMPALTDIYVRYSSRCRQADAMDFDDILLHTYHLLDKFPDVCAKYADRFRYVLVDEYQDTNYAQHRIVWQLTSQRQRVCVVGDDAQSIYSFRGANIDNILTFRDCYTDVHLFKLEQNYRSTQSIVNAANSLICKNTRQIHKQVFSEKEQGDPIMVSEAYSDVEEGQIVLRQIRDIHRRESCEYSEFAILYRTNAQSRVFEDAFRKSGIPYRIYGGLSFYQRKEIKDVIAYMRLAVNPNDEEALKRVINYPARGIGNTTLAKIVDAASRSGVSLWTVLGDPVTYGLSFTRGTASKLGSFYMLISSFQQLTQTVDVEHAGQEIIRKSGILTDIYQDTTPESVARQENLQELLNGMADFCSSRIEEGNNNVSITDYLNEVSLISDVDTDKSDDEHKVTLMTIHSAKGLEFPYVFVVGLEENLFPSQLASGSQREMEEERRLFYVALTRAEKECYLSYAKSRFRYGKMEFGNPSRFISDIDPRLLRRSMSMRRTYAGEVELPWKSQRRSDYDDYSRRGGYDDSPRRTSYGEAPRPRPASMGSVGRSPYSNPNLRPASSLASSPPASPSHSFADIKVGDRIEHQRFGIGEILKVEGEDTSLKATVQFENAGTKQLLMKFAKFKKL